MFEMKTINGKNIRLYEHLFLHQCHLISSINCFIYLVLYYSNTFRNT